MAENDTQSIMLIDDTPENLKLLDKMLTQKGYHVLSFPRGRLAINAALRKAPDLILLDINMPEMNGYEVCRILKSDVILKDIPVIFISALDETLDKVKAFQSGGIDYITKPFQFEEVNARVETHLRLRRMQAQLEDYNKSLEEKVREQVKDIYNSHMAMMFAMAKLAESRDDDTGKHLERVQTLCKFMSEKLSKKPAYSDLIDNTFITNIYHTSPLHDIGKVGIPDGILLKPGKLTPDEFEIMKTHTIIGSGTLEAVLEKYPKNSFLEMGIEIARHHHEKWDGSGYPDRLSKKAIPLSARIMSIVDVYDALRSERVYKKAFTHETACEMIAESCGKQFDPSIVDAFMEISEEIDDVRSKL